MRGARFGELVKVTPKGIAHVRLDATGKVARFLFDDCTRVW